MSEMGVPVIDCEVAVAADPQGIAGHTDPVWEGWHAIIPPLPYKAPVRTQAEPLTVEGLRAELLDARDVERAVLCPAPHPGDAVTQFEYHAAYTRAVNDWLAAEWLEHDERLYGSVQVMPQLPDEAAREVDRWGDHPRMLQVLLPARGGEGFGVARYRPIFEAAARHDLAVALRVSATTRTAVGFPESLAEWHAGRNQSVMGQVLSLCFSGLFDEHPGLRVVLLGGGWTWVPYLAWTMDSNWRPLRAEVPWIRRPPSEFVPRNLFFGATPFPSGAPTEDLLEMIGMAGSDGWLVWASGYPDHGHASPDVLDGFPSGLRSKVLRDNALRLYGPRLERVGAAV